MKKINQKKKKSLTFENSIYIDLNENPHYANIIESISNLETVKIYRDINAPNQLVIFSTKKEHSYKQHKSLFIKIIYNIIKKYFFKPTSFTDRVEYKIAKANNIEISDPNIQTNNTKILNYSGIFINKKKLGNI